MLPIPIQTLIFEFHDEFEIADKKRSCEIIIRTSYRWWLSDRNTFFFSMSEYAAKQEIFMYQSPHIFFTNAYLWHKFMRYFKIAEQLYKHGLLKKLVGPLPPW